MWIAIFLFCFVSKNWQIYPTSLRSTGVGVASSVGRIGGMICPLVSVGLVHGCHQTVAIFLFECIIIVSGISVLPFPFETRGRQLRDNVACSTWGNVLLEFIAWATYFYYQIACAEFYVKIVVIQMTRSENWSCNADDGQKTGTAVQNSSHDFLPRNVLFNYQITWVIFWIKILVILMNDSENRSCYADYWLRFYCNGLLCKCYGFILGYQAL